MRTAATICLLFLISISAAGQTAADLVLINANIRTLDDKNPRAEALAVTNGKIVAVGTRKVVERFIGDRTKVIDAGGKLVIPGFNDAHVHLAGIGNSFSHLDLRDARNSKEIISKVRYFASVLPNGRWIMARGWNSSRPDTLPSLVEIDAVSPNDPLLLYSIDYSYALVNTAAMRLASVASAGGIITGADLEKVRRAVPADHEKNWAEIIETASNYAASLGLTSVQDVHSDDLLSVLKELEAKGKLKARVYECIGLSDRRKSIDAGLTAAKGDPMVRGGCVKGMSDGSVEEIAELRQQVAEADRAGLQVMVHAIGPRANANTLDAFEKAIAANGPRDRRFRVEHAARVRPADIPRFSRPGIIASMQPHLFYSGPLSGDNFRRFKFLGTRMAFGSDASITDLNPLLGIYAAVESGSRSITIEEAVTAYTLGSAYAEFQEASKGTLEVGKLADLIILSEDIFSIDPATIPNSRVLKTIVGGRVVYEAK